MKKACLENIQAYSEPCVTPAYSEHLHIQNRGIFGTGIFRTLEFSEPEANSEPCQMSTMDSCAKIVNSYSCFRKL